LKDGIVKYAGGPEVITEEVIEDVFGIHVKKLEVEGQTIFLGGHIHEH
jgi:ABC-type cobalamin/Fe3+-siderophores transport system ATPase subunit